MTQKLSELHKVFENILTISDYRYDYEKKSYTQLNLKYISLGNDYYLGRDVNQNYSKAIKYYKKASKNNSKEAYYALGFMYTFGITVDKNYKIAMKYFKKSCSLGYIEGCFAYALIFSTKDSIQYLKNYRIYVKYLKKACNGGYGVACLHLANTNGLDDKKVIKYYKRACDNHITEACKELEWIYKNNNDYNKSYKYLKIACKKGCSEACFDYAEGQIKGGDYRRGLILIAFKYYKKAAKLGNLRALRVLASLYEYGNSDSELAEKIIEKDISRAIKYLKKSCNAGDAIACNSLGDIYKYGQDDIKKNQKKSLMYYTKSCHYGFDNSIDEINSEADFDGFIESVCSNLGNKYLDGDEVEQDMKKVEKLFKIGCKYNSKESYYNLGLFYKNIGKYKKALKLFVKCYNNMGLRDESIRYINEIEEILKENDENYEKTILN